MDDGPELATSASSGQTLYEERKLQEYVARLRTLQNAPLKSRLIKLVGESQSYDPARLATQLGTTMSSVITTVSTIYSRIKFAKNIVGKKRQMYFVAACMYSIGDTDRALQLMQKLEPKHDDVIANAASDRDVEDERIILHAVQQLRSAPFIVRTAARCRAKGLSVAEELHVTHDSAKTYLTRCYAHLGLSIRLGHERRKKLLMRAYEIYEVEDQGYRLPVISSNDVPLVLSSPETIIDIEVVSGIRKTPDSDNFKTILAERRNRGFEPELLVIRTGSDSSEVTEHTIIFIKRIPS